jgi:hypothetical protein
LLRLAGPPHFFRHCSLYCIASRCYVAYTSMIWGVITYCARVAAEPNLLLPTSGLPTTFDGTPLKRVDVFRAVQGYADKLPHLQGMISAFFHDAHVQWTDFAEDFVEDTQIAKLTSDQRQAAFLNTTNDRNEGALGLLRVAMRHAPNLSLQGFNARMLL